MLQTVIERRRETWAELFVWNALWLREAGGAEEPSWPELAIVAAAIAQGHDLARIPLMEFIAAITLDAMLDLRGASRGAM